MKKKNHPWIFVFVIVLLAFCFVSCKPENQNEENNSPEEYTPIIGLSDCLSDILKSSDRESFCYKITEDSRLLVEHRLMVLNCGRTVVVTSLEQHGDILTLSEEECFGQDSMLAICVCEKIPAQGSGLLVL